jgi:hypothetical protein
LAAFALLGVLVVPFAWRTAKARRLGTDDRENLQGRWTPAIQQDKESAIAVRQPDTAAQLTSVLGTTIADGAFALSSTRRAEIEKSKISSCVMPLSAEVCEFLEVASAALPRITEIIFAFPADHRAGALEMAERRYRQAARDFGCAEADSERWVAAVMRKLRTLM